MSSSAHPHYDAIIVGAGFAGMYAIHRLRKLGFTMRCFEAGADVGGTWYFNRYPGARCDSESLEYSYSFDKELEQEWNWTEKYAGQPEILDYINHVAERFDLRRDVTFNTKVTSADYDEAANLWRVTTDRGETVTAQYCIMAVGCLSAPNTPPYKGIESFAGTRYHTGAWPHDGVDFTGKRVAVMGTGSTGIQAITAIAKTAKHLVVLQRTANFSLPARNEPLAVETIADFKKHYPQTRQRARYSPSGNTYIGDWYGTQPALSVSTEEREAEYERRWQLGGGKILAAYSDLGTNEAANATVAEFVRRKIREIVKNPQDAASLVPTGYPIGAKRICLDSGYYEVFNQENVTLVDLKKTPIEEFMAAGVRTTAASFDLDCIVFATGFDAMTGTLKRIDIRGRDGLALAEKWEAGPRSYLGVGSAGFPNLFIVTGPGSPSVLSTVLCSIEQHVEMITDCMDYLRGHGFTTIEPQRDAEDRWVEYVNELAAATLHVKANSWYLGANIPGKPRVFMPYIGGVGRYRKECEEIVADGYRGFMLSAPASSGERRQFATA